MSGHPRSRHLLADERGQSLVLALLVLTVLAITLGAVITFTAGNQRNAAYQKAAQVARTLAEAGINNGVSILSNPTNSCCLIDSSLMPSSLATANTSTYPSGTVKWWGTIDNQMVWTLHAQATVPNPTGPAASPIVKTMTAQVQVHSPPPKKIDVAVWNTIYSPYGPTSSCDTTVAQGVNLTVPLYVGGNLCLANSATVNAPVYVGGYLYVNNKQASIGSSAAPVHSAHVGSYCKVQNNGTQVNPCVSEPVTKNSPDTNIWVQNPSSWNPLGLPSDFIDPATGKLITAPTICWGPGSCAGDPVGGWYTASSPGPLHPCQTVSGTPPVFDNDTTWGPQEGQPGGSVPGTFNLTPPQSYTCKTANGELSWNANTNTLTVAGTIFIDGSVTATTAGNKPIEYTGWGSNGQCTNNGDCQAVIYVSGTVFINSVKLCAVINQAGNDCDWKNWDPNKKMLIFAANYQGTQTGVGPNQGIVVGPSQTSFQGGLYATYQIVTGQSATTEGPLVSGQQTVITGQQFGGTFPPITILPISIQTYPQGFWIDPPKNYQFGG
ncbi:MAG TPA: hypothetical protein VFA06_20490 [Actinocrinis sp.]|uniref:hypothetical protein n=1 Tax=Actinocrinis sp. TaxID=1920516 RepID=UPI002D3503C2|nr:hypothetical protein [Actinocrinis sp.]HZU58268.1 hypothetical protein [Actinocrinis sp.]